MEQVSPKIFERNLKECQRKMDNYGRRHLYVQEEKRILKRLSKIYMEINEENEGKILRGSKVNYINK